MLRYTLMRVLIFFGVLCVLWLVGLRSEDQRILLLLLSVVISMVVSFFLLKDMRNEVSRSIAQRLDARGARSRDRRGDELAEDAEDAEDDFRA